jgi:spermidine synthase
MFWKTRAGVCIYRSPNHVEVRDNGFFRWMIFTKGWIQTLIHKRHPEKPYLPYMRAMLATVEATASGSGCLLGLGGGGMLHALSPFFPGYRFTAVEVNAEVIQVALQYFYLDKIKNLEIVQEDAALWIANSRQKFDNIWVDLADAQEFPAACCQEAFFVDCKERLTERGLLAINLVSLQQEARIFTWIRTLFSGSTLLIPIGNYRNKVMLAATKDTLSTWIELRIAEKRIQKLIWDPLWGNIARFY